MHIATSYLYMFESENVSTLCESTWISVDKISALTNFEKF